MREARQEVTARDASPLFTATTVSDGVVGESASCRSGEGEGKEAGLPLLGRLIDVARSV